jgi:hypothetical protein
MRDDDAETIPITNGNRSRKGAIIGAFLLITLVFGAGVVASFLMGGAEVTVYPRHWQPNVNAEFSAFKNAPAGELAYEVMTLEQTGERQVAASGQQEVEELATGRITIYKSTPGTQRLIRNTRFSDASGKIFRIDESVVVPGAVDGTPGSIQAPVFADVAGEEYNLAAGTRLTIPGLASDPALFNAMYATNEESFTGGFKGPKFIIDEEQLATARQSLQQELRNALLERLPTERPSNAVLFTDAVAFTYEALPSVAYGDNLATIKERAVLQVPLFEEDEFASYLAAATIPGYEGQPVRINDYSAITFRYVSATTSTSNIANEEGLTFTLAGRPLVVSTYDVGRLTTDLLGAQKTALNAVLSGYPAIERAEAVIRPFWERSFPTNINAITVTEVIPSANPAQ